MGKIVIGQIVRYKDFWERDEVDDIWDAINSGNHILDLSILYHTN
jgi:hypothetical protein